MTESNDKPRIGVIGAGTMGTGIAQIAATHGHDVALIDASKDALERAIASLKKIFARLIEKGRMDQPTSEAILDRIHPSSGLGSLAGSELVIEAIVENVDVKREVFQRIESIVDDDAIIATNTSSLSVTAIGSCLKHDDRAVGIHFFNPAPLMPLVEIVPSISTDPDVLADARAQIDEWGKVTVVAKDTPGFIVNRVARPFYGESLRMLEEGVADVATIDHALTAVGGFRMGPFTLMDLIGNDVNYTVTETVFQAFYNDPRYRPALTQKRLMEAGWLGRKSGRGYYTYGDDAPKPEPGGDDKLHQQIVDRVVTMLINEAVDAVFWDVASPTDIDLAMTKGVNYPKGLLAWCDEIGAETIQERMIELRETFFEDRYRPSPLLASMAKHGTRFFE